MNSAGAGIISKSITPPSFCFIATLYTYIAIKLCVHDKIQLFCFRELRTFFSFPMFYDPKKDPVCVCVCMCVQSDFCPRVFSESTERVTTKFGMGIHMDPKVCPVKFERNRAAFPEVTEWNGIYLCTA